MNSDPHVNNLLNIAFLEHTFVLDPIYEMSLLLPILTLQFYILDKEVYVNGDQWETFYEYLKDPLMIRYFTNDIKQVLLVESEESKTKESIKLTSILVHLKGLKTVCYQKPSRNLHYQSTNLHYQNQSISEEPKKYIQDEILESLKVCPQLELIHMAYSKSQFIKYFLGLDLELFQLEIDLTWFPSIIENARPCWPNLIDFNIYSFVDSEFKYLTHRILKKVNKVERFVIDNFCPLTNLLNAINFTSKFY